MIIGPDEAARLVEGGEFAGDAVRDAVGSPSGRGPAAEAPVVGSTPPSVPSGLCDWCGFAWPCPRFDLGNHRLASTTGVCT